MDHVINRDSKWSVKHSQQYVGDTDIPDYRCVIIVLLLNFLECIFTENLHNHNIITGYESCTFINPSPFHAHTDPNPVQSLKTLYHN